MPRTYFSSLPLQCRSISPLPLYPLIKKKTYQYLPTARTSLAGRIHRACYTVPHKHKHTHTSPPPPSWHLHPMQGKTRETPHWIRNNILIISLFFFIFTPARKTVSLMPWMSVSASAVNSPLVQSLQFLFMSLLFLWFLLDTHTHRCKQLAQMLNGQIAWKILWQSPSGFSLSNNRKIKSTDDKLERQGIDTLIYNGVLSKWMQYQKCMADVYMRLHQ